MIRYLFLLGAVVVLVSGCVKDREEEFSSSEAEVSPEQPGNRSKTESRDRPADETSPGDDERLLLEMEKTEPEEEDTAAVLTRLESGQRTLLALRDSDAVTPNDTEIGELQTTARYAEPGVSRIHAVAEGFLTGLVEGRIAGELIDEEWRWFLESSLDDPLSEGAIPERYRLGVIRIDGETARANVRLLSSRGRCSGEIFFVLSGPEAGWRITDFQADLYKLLEDYNVTGRFEPKMYDMTDLF